MPVIPLDYDESVLQWEAKKMIESMWVKYKSFFVKMTFFEIKISVFQIVILANNNTHFFHILENDKHMFIEGGQSGVKMGVKIFYMFGHFFLLQMG